MAKKEAKAPAEGGASAGGRGKLKLIILGVAALLLAVSLSVGATWFFLSRGDQAAEPAKDEAAATTESTRQPAIYQELAPAFVVNFSQNGRQRYMQVSVALMARDQAQLDALKVHMPVLRNKLVMLFSGQNFDSLVTPVGKEMLRQQATATVQELSKQETGALAIEQVLFTNFVLQ